MSCGISTACFYPMETRQALAVVQKAGVAQTEIFLNTFSELEENFVLDLERQLAQNPVQITALHPFSCSMDPFFFATEYSKRMEDGLALYRQYFALCKRLGASVLVFHGDFLQTQYPFDLYCENIARLRDEGRKYGVELCQENVARCKCGMPEYIRKMRTFLRDDISFVLDVKQMRRVGATLPELLDAMRGKIRHVHLSDKTQTSDCAVPGVGDFDFNALYRTILAGQPDTPPTAVVELYRGDFTDIDALLAGVGQSLQIW